MKQNSILSILFYSILVVALFIDIDQYIPHFTDFYPILFILYFLYYIYKSMQYKKNQPENEIRLKSNNDSYFRISPFIFGSLVCICSILFFYLFGGGKIKLILFFMIGLLSICNGFIFIPSVLIKGEKDNLYFENAKENKSIAIEQIESIGLSDNNITVKIKNDKNYSFQNLGLNQNEIHNAVHFLKKYFNGKIVEN